MYVLFVYTIIHALYTQESRIGLAENISSNHMGISVAVESVITAVGIDMVSTLVATCLHLLLLVLTLP